MTTKTEPTARTRVIVRLLDIYADDLRSGTDYEQAVAMLLGCVAKAITGDGARADKVAEDARELRGEG